MGLGDKFIRGIEKFEKKVDAWAAEGEAEERRKKAVSFVDELGPELTGKMVCTGDSCSSGKAKTADALAGKTVALYFSAHWCPPCRAFTPQLAEWYTKDLAAKGLEIVFVSWDKDQGSFDEYLDQMPWKALPFSARDKKDALGKKLHIKGIPSLVIFDADGTLITTEGREVVTQDPTGSKFPWKGA
jgi:thiol-disulfide isomerase/thioredoxin